MLSLNEHIAQKDPDTMARRLKSLNEKVPMSNCKTCTKNLQEFCMTVKVPPCTKQPKLRMSKASSDIAKSVQVDVDMLLAQSKRNKPTLTQRNKLALAKRSLKNVLNKYFP